MTPWFSVSVRELDRSFITGLLEGDGCFTISEHNGGQSYSCGSSRRLRADDQPLLEWLLAVTGVGRLCRVPVLEYRRELGRTPRAMEFFRWRQRAAPDTPTQGTVYRLFPGGWAAVIDACALVHQPAAAPSLRRSEPAR